MVRRRHQGNALRTWVAALGRLWCSDNYVRRSISQTLLVGKCTGNIAVAGLIGSIFSTIVFGTGVPPGVRGLSLELTREALRLRVPSGTISTSSGTASWVRMLYASVPGTSPWAGSSSTRSTRVMGMGEVMSDRAGWPSVASEKCSSLESATQC
jgi:hypothetical protein